MPRRQAVLGHPRGLIPVRCRQELLAANAQATRREFNKYILQKKMHVKKFLGILILVCLGPACEKSNSEIVLSGTYAGNLSLSTGATTIVMPIAITFSGNTYQDFNDDSTVSMICNGNFQITKDSINFQNQCIYPPGVDFITTLGGNYRIYTKGDSVAFTRTSSTTPVADALYTLKKQ
jgi:hypothetical protein